MLNWCDSWKCFHVPASSPHSAPWRAAENTHLCQGSPTVPTVINCNGTFPSLPSFNLQWRAMNNNNCHVPVSCQLCSLKTPAKSSTTDQENIVSPFRTPAAKRALVMGPLLHFLLKHRVLPGNTEHEFQPRSQVPLEVGEGTVYCMGWSFLCSSHSVACRPHARDEHLSLILRVELAFAAYWNTNTGTTTQLLSQHVRCCPVFQHAVHFGNLPLVWQLMSCSS